MFEQRVNWNKRVQVNLKPLEYRYLGDDSKCSNESNIALFKSFLRDADFTKCQEKCSPYHFLNDLMPSCGWGDDLKKDAFLCSYNIISDNWNAYQISHGFKKPCKVLEYQGEQTFEWDNKYNQAVIQYRFSPPMMTNVQQEYLIFDIIGMIGSVGGTLGMCIGFSFSGVTTFILDFIQVRIINYN